MCFNPFLFFTRIDWTTIFEMIQNKNGDIAIFKNLEDQVITWSINIYVTYPNSFSTYIRITINVFIIENNYPNSKHLWWACLNLKSQGARHFILHIQRKQAFNLLLIFIIIIIVIVITTTIFRFIDGIFHRYLYYHFVGN